MRFCLLQDADLDDNLRNCCTRVTHLDHTQQVALLRLLVILGVAGVLTGCGSDRSAKKSLDAANGPGRVPIHAKRPTPVPTNVPASMPICSRSLRLRETDPIAGQTGERSVFYEILNSGASPCKLKGYPRVRYFAGKQRLPFTYRNGVGAYVSHAAPQAVLLRARGFAYLKVGKFRCDLGIRTVATRIAVSLPGVSTPLARRLGQSPARDSAVELCSHGRTDPGNALTLSPMASSHEGAGIAH